MQIRFRDLIFIAMIGIFSSCNNFNNPGEELILNVDNEFEIAIKEILDNDVRAVEFTITSLDKQNCQEAFLKLIQKTTLNSLNIEISDILFPENCGDKASFPVGSALFNIAERLYQLEVNIQDLVNHKGILEVTNEYYSLNLNNGNGLIPTSDFLYRIPDNFIWGYYQSNKEEEIQILESFFEQNNLVFKNLKNLSEGYYSYFDIDGEGNIIIEDIPNIGTVKSFGFANIDFETISEAVASFKESNPDLNLKIFGSNGTKY